MPAFGLLLEGRCRWARIGEINSQIPSCPCPHAGHYEAQPSHLLWALLHHCPPLGAGGGGSVTVSVSLANPLAHALQRLCPTPHVPWAAVGAWSVCV